MILDETLNKLIRDTVNLIVNGGVAQYAYRLNQDAPRPAGPYASIYLMIDDGIGWEQTTLEDRDEDLDIDITISGVRRLTVSLQFFRAGAIDNARKVRTLLTRESILTILRDAGLGLNSRSEVRPVPEPLSDGWEERAQFDLVLNATGTDTEIIRSIIAVDIQSEFQARGLVHNFNIEVQ